MKNIRTIIILFILTIVNIAHAQHWRLPFESGTLVEIISTMSFVECDDDALDMDTVVSTWKVVTYFRHWGEQKTIEGIEESATNPNSVVIQDFKENTSWIIHPKEKTGYKTVRSNMAPPLEEYEMIDDLDEETYLGYTCKKIVRRNVNRSEETVLTYNNLTMKTELIGNKGRTSRRIISIDLTPPPASKFEVPKDVKFEELKKE